MFNKPFRTWHSLLQPLSRLLLPLTLIIILSFTGCAYASPGAPRDTIYTIDIDFDRLVICVIQIESNGNPNAISPAGAIGLMQITPICLKEHNQNSPYTYRLAEMFDPTKNVDVGLFYLKRLYHYYKCPTVEHILAAYNGGITRLRNNNWDIKKMPRETRDYVKRVLHIYKEGIDIIQ